MTKAELEAIRERQAEERRVVQIIHGSDAHWPESSRWKRVLDVDALLAEVERLRGMHMKGLECPDCGYRFETVAKLDGHSCPPDANDLSVFAGPAIKPGDLLRLVSERIRRAEPEAGAFDTVGMSLELWRRILADIGVREDPLGLAVLRLQGVQVRIETIPSDRVRLYLKGDLVGEIVGFTG